MKVSFSGILGGLISLAVGCLILAGTWGAYADHSRIQKYNGQAIGKITKKHFQTTAEGGGNYYLDYSFVISGGDEINASGEIAKQQWDALQVGDTLEIRYDRSDPRRSVPRHGRSSSLVLAFFMLALGCVFIIFGASRIRTSFKKG